MSGFAAELRGLAEKYIKPEVDMIKGKLRGKSHCGKILVYSERIRIQ